MSLEEVYHRCNGVVTKRDEDGNSISSVSAPQVQAHMLEQAEITVGMRILEIGSGGYNAALLAELVGPSGQVTTVDIDEDITDRASRLLGDAGYSRVNVVLADAEGGVPEYAPYDRILVTAGAWDVPPTWVAQLAEGARLLVPLQWAVAARCGIAVPRSLVTNDPAAVQRFAAQSRTGVVVKPLTANLLYEDNTYKMGWTRKLSADDLADLRGVDSTAHLVQDWVEKAWECRAVVVGDEVFAVAIHAGSEAARIDWRSDYPALSYEVIDLPPSVKKALRAIMDELGPSTARSIFR